MKLFNYKFADVLLWAVILAVVLISLALVYGGGGVEP
jgi:hypothetical protein